MTTTKTRNPFTAWALTAEIGDSMHGQTVTARETVGTAANPAAFIRVTFADGYDNGREWVQDYPASLIQN